MEIGRGRNNETMHNSKPLVSIIMPVYNAEKYLSEAIESALNQTYKDFELLLINDRSSDSSKEICMEYSKKDDRIILLENNSENHGPGPTRNIGLDHAKGEFIYFMDADDWIDKKLLQYSVNQMQKTNADIVQFGVVYERDDKRNPEKYFWKGKKVLTKDEIKQNFSAYWKENRNSLWIHLFRREVVNSIRFEDIVNGEDISYVMDALCNAEKIAYITKVLYHYRYVQGSASHRWIKNTMECREIIWKHQRHFLQSFQGGIDKQAYTEVAYDNYIWAIYQLSSNSCMLSYKDKKKELLKIKEKIEFEKYRNLYPLKLQHGIQKIKYTLVKYRWERILLLLGPTFLKIVRGE